MSVSDEELPSLCSNDIKSDEKSDEESDEELELPSLCSNNMKNNEEDSWEEMEEEKIVMKCLFCNNSFNSNETAVNHLKIAHQFDFSELKQKFQMDDYSYIKMINYIKTHNPNVNIFLEAKIMFWNNDVYLKPVENDDAWLMFDFDSVKIKTQTTNEALMEDANKIIESLQQEIKTKNLLLEQAYKDMEIMKKTFQNTIENNSENDKIKNSGVPCVASVSLQEDQEYFNSYSHYGIHHDMLTDEVRTKSYRNAILKNSSVFKGKDVLDLGCGTSILSMFSSESGAANVIGVDQSDIIYQAMDIVRKNRFKNIKLVKGRIEDTELPIDKVDIIVSEWMGYFLLFEGMLDSVIYARNRHLKPGGIILPNRCNISLVGFGDVHRYNEFIEFWENVYGYNMSCMRKEVLREATVEVCDPEYVLTQSNTIAEFDLMTVDVNCPNFTFDFNLNVLKSGRLTSFVGYFDTFFDLPEKVEFSTSPFFQPTHWKQIVFYLNNPVHVKIGDVVTGKFICQRHRRDVRSLTINIEVFGIVLNYSLN